MKDKCYRSWWHSKPYQNDPQNILANIFGEQYWVSATCTKHAISWAVIELLNPLTTNDNYSRHWNSAACYQLVQSILKIGFALAETVRQGEVGGWYPMGDDAWWLLQLVSTGWAICLLYCINRRRNLHLWHFRQLLVQKSVLLSESPNYWMLANKWVWSRSWTCKGHLKEAVVHVSRANSKQKSKYSWKKVEQV